MINEICNIISKGELLKIVMSFPKTVWFNFRYLPISASVKLPIWIHYSCKYNVWRGGLKLPNKCQPAMIRIGFHTVPICDDKDMTKVIVEKGGVIEFQGGAHIGNGSKFYVAEKGHLVLGENFAISASSAINCYYRIIMGKDIQFSWNCLVMDSDTHCIYDDLDDVINEDRSIELGDKIWIGCNSMILKGSAIPSNCVIGANSLVSGKKFEKSSIIVGNPAKSIKKIGGWRL